MSEQVIIPCSTCGGSGRIPVEYRVTREMALDACAPEMAGQSYTEWERCPTCGGDGMLGVEEKSDAGR